MSVHSEVQPEVLSCHTKHPDIQKQEEINFRLQDYIDRIIVAIMETNPSILEVK